MTTGSASLRPPARVVHADWGLQPRKRWQVRAELQADGRYQIEGPERAPSLDAWADAVFPADREQVTLAGFDFPIGLPQAYARRVGVTAFLELLPLLGQGEWAEFFQVATIPDEVSLHRPFYPRASGPKGTTKRAHLLAGLGVERIDELLRRCDLRTAERRAACTLFWTLGGNQVGKGAISGWQALFLPLLASGRPLRFWPFQGGLEPLLRGAGLVVAETYPTECYRHLGLDVRSKRDQADRRRNADALLGWADGAGVALSAVFEEAVRDGFGSRGDGEDRFDAAVGLCGMLNVVLGQRGAGRHPDPVAEQVEGWIFGQESLDAPARQAPLARVPQPLAARTERRRLDTLDRKQEERDAGDDRPVQGMPPGPRYR